MYKCIEGFTVDICDGDGFTIEESGFVVEEGSIWEVNEEAINLLGADIHLENDDSWIEISKEILEECFIKIK
ncbi:Uncharacterised protein [[Clostridium] sordellii]|uniref:Uncharacterized protein n=1 Tax=Paraclostridium sordellii TaxID=1505 RepID=A0A0C7R4D2_PARSO|nr:hypothetical protein [Paeniclostridium sordellii]CEQ04103.1 Uncharacterised protein [[Clostridium] sordellii] [Paeniclostridium sordellii]